MGHPYLREFLGLSGAAVGEFAPVEGEVGDEEVADGEQGEGHGEAGLGHVEVGRQEVEEAGEDEVEREGVGADHPLAVHGDLPVAGGDEGGQSADEPGDGLKHAHKPHGEAEAAEAKNQGHGCGDKDGDDVGLAHEPVEREMALTEAGGELEGAKDRGEDASDGVRDEQEAVGDDLAGIGIVGVDEDGVFAGPEDGEAGETHDDPKDVFGFEAGGWADGWGGGGSGHD